MAFDISQVDGLLFAYDNAKDGPLPQGVIVFPPSPDNRLFGTGGGPELEARSRFPTRTFNRLWNRGYWTTGLRAQVCVRGGHANLSPNEARAKRMTEGPPQPVTVPLAERVAARRDRDWTERDDWGSLLPLP